YSDGRIKENVKEDVGGLDFILKLRPVTYNINLDKENQLLGITDESNLSNKYDIEKIKQSGFIAQEVEEVAKETNYDFSGIQKPKHEKDLYGLSYAEFVVPLVKGMQEQQEQMNKLVLENADLKARIERLEQLLSK
ncbi:MAG: tail fiber domain-containing protein, partial [Bacteroidetes bacterium]|nr:tail fiber domain-containing protein [Bacteroidota bacterium]